MVQELACKRYGDYLRDGFEIPKYGCNWLELQEEMPPYEAWQLDEKKVVLKYTTMDYSYLADTVAEEVGAKLVAANDQHIDGADQHN